MTRDKPNINGCIDRAITALEKSGIDLSDKEREQALADLKALRDAVPDVEFGIAQMQSPDGAITYRDYFKVIKAAQLLSQAIGGDDDA